MADAELFVAHWGLDEAACSALLQLDPEVQAKVIADFAPKPGTRDVNKLFHGFIRSVKSSSLSAQNVHSFKNGGVDAVTIQDGFSAASANPSVCGWHVSAESIDVESFLARWGLDFAAHAVILDQSPEVQARVMAEFAPKPGTRDVNRLFYGFIKSVRSSSLPQQILRLDDGTSNTPQCKTVGCQGSTFYDLHNISENSDLDYAEAERRSFGISKALHLRSGGILESVDTDSFILHWGLDAVAQASLLQLSPEVQAKVVAEFAPKPGTRDVNKLLHGFIRSVQSSCSLFPGGRSMSACHPVTRAGDSGVLHEGVDVGETSEAITTACHWGAAGNLSSLTVSSDTASEDVALQSFVDHWGLDAGSVAALVQLGPEARARVVTEFAPKPHTQDVNRLFRGFIRSVTCSVSTSSRVHSTIKPVDLEMVLARNRSDRSWESLYTGPIPAEIHDMGDVPTAWRSCPSDVLRPGGDEGLAAERAAYDVPAVMSFDSAKRAALGDSIPSHEDMNNFAQVWCLGDECLLTLEGQTPDVQRRVLDQFRPKPGTRDVRSLFYGFIRSVARGGGKRPRIS